MVDNTPGDLTSVHLRKALAGDQAELEWVVAHFHPLVLAQVRVRLGGASASDDDVRDLADEVWLVTLRRLRDLRPAGGRLAPVLVRFLATTSVNLCNNHLRSLARRKGERAGVPARADRSAPFDFEDPETGVVTRATRQELHSEVARALGAIPERQRSILVLRLLESGRNQDIARTLGIPGNTVAVAYRRALESLRRALPKSIYTELQQLRR